MSKIAEIAGSAQNGALISSIATRLGMDADAVGAVISAMIPHLSAAMGEPDRLPTVVKGSLQGIHQRSFASGDGLAGESATSAGEQALRDLFGNEEVVQALAAAVAAKTGLPSDKVSAVLPGITSAVLGGVFHALKDQGLGHVLGQLGAALTQSGGARSSTAGAGNLDGAMGDVLSSFLHAHGSTVPQGEASELQRAVSALREVLGTGARDVDQPAEVRNILEMARAVR